jgi:very-short-patch-repair endonuclease
MTKDLDHLVRRQDGVLARRQALAAGMTKHAWDWQLTRGRWQRVLPGVAVTHSGPVTSEQQARAAVLYAGRDAALGGRASLAFQGMTLPGVLTVTTAVDVVVPLDRRVVDADGPGAKVAVHRIKQPGRWTVTRRGLLVARAQASVLHAAAWASSDVEAELVLTAAVQQRRTAVPLVREALALMPELFRRALVREVLDDIELGAHAASERRFLAMCRRHQLPLPDELQRRVRTASGTCHLDAHYRAQRLSVEVDGAHHREAGTWDADALRTLRLAAARPGEQLLRITTGMLRHHEAEVAALLRAVLVGRAAA